MTATKEWGVAHEAAAPALALENLWVSYNGGLGSGRRGENGEGYALRDVTFRVAPGSRLAVVGPNGAGKSTLFKVLVGIIRPARGSVEVFGRAPGEHLCIAYVPQRSQIDWTFPVTVEDVVMMGRAGQIGLFRWPGRHDRAVVRRSLERVNIAHLAQKQIGELSGGQQQRVFIARALAQQAEVVLLDEPFTGLDVPSHKAIFEVLDGLQEEGVTALVATHDLNLAAERFDSILLLNREIVAYGEPDSVLTAPNLVRAYGGHMHVVGDEGMVLMDTCCEGDA